MPTWRAARSTTSSASTLSPVLWRKLPGARSAGRVQSVALRLVCDRELEIEKFVAREYWSLVATLATKDGGVFEARLVGADGQKIQRLDIGTGEEADAFRAISSRATFTRGRRSRRSRRSATPAPPFTDLDPAAGGLAQARLRARQTMRVAQRLYEGVDIGGETVGLITYMRTDGIDMAPEAIAAGAPPSPSDYGERYLPARRASTRTRPRTRRKRTRRSARPTWPHALAGARTSSPSRPSSTS